MTISRAALIAILNTFIFAVDVEQYHVIMVRDMLLAHHAVQAVKYKQ